MAYPPFLIDTHCHLDAAEFDRDRDAVRQDAEANGVRAIVIPAIAVSNFATVARLARGTAGGHYALGIHPLLTPSAAQEDIAVLRQAVAASLDDPRFVGIGEIGLDLFVPSLTTADAIARQTWFFDEQLRVARDFDLPVLLHVRRAQDQVLAGLRRVRRGHDGMTATGIAHAFNGSRQQADQYVALGFKLGFGGAATYERALRIRALARDLPIDAIVLETDAPDIAPVWLHHGEGLNDRNAPGELRRIAIEIAALRGIDLDSLAVQTTQNALAVLPRLRAGMDAGLAAGLAAVSASRGATGPSIGPVSSGNAASPGVPASSSDAASNGIPPSSGGAASNGIPASSDGATSRDVPPSSRSAPSLDVPPSSSGAPSRDVTPSSGREAARDVPVVAVRVADAPIIDAH